MTLKVDFATKGEEATQPPDPAYPHGVDIDVSDGRYPACSTVLPRVATIGYFVVTCDACGKKAMVTAAGRPDDPRSYKMACNVNERQMKRAVN